MPDYDTKREIFVHKARKDGMDFSEEVIDYICKQMIHNVRELEGVMISLLAQSAFIKRDLTLEVVQDIWKDCQEAETGRRIDCKQNTASGLRAF